MITSKEQLKISIIQFYISTTNPSRNIETIISLLESEKQQFDVVILPEMAITGFDFKKLEKNVKHTNHYISILKEISAQYNTAICTTLPFQEGEVIYNRLFFITPAGNLFWYDKHYLISWGGFREKEYFQNGNAVLVIHYLNWIFGFAICYDLRFPELFYKMNLYSLEKFNGFLDLILIPSQWPKERIQHLMILAKARAIENQCYIGIANSIGKNDSMIFNGHSLLIDPEGNYCIELTDQEKVLYTHTKKNDLKNIRKQRPILKDRFALKDMLTK